MTTSRRGMGELEAEVMAILHLQNLVKFSKQSRS